MNNTFNIPKYDDLIYDVGLHKGEDTQFYLDKGFRVIAFEANPELSEFCRLKFKRYIDEGQLKIVEGAIVDMDTIETGKKKISFYKNDDDSVWGTICADWAERNLRRGTKSSLIEVDIINFSEVIKENGVPYYLKIDIEGADLVCLKMLRNLMNRPDYVSIESDKTSYANIKYEIKLLNDLGYDTFQAIEQSTLPLSQSPPNPSREGQYVPQIFQRGASGLFGAELNDVWKSKKEILRKYLAIRLGYFLLGDDGIMNHWKFRGAWRLKSFAQHFCTNITKAAVPGWYDTHARYKDVSK